MFFKKYEIAIPPTECPIKIEGLYFLDTCSINLEYKMALNVLLPEAPCAGASTETILKLFFFNALTVFFHLPELLSQPCANKTVSLAPLQL